MQPAPQASLHQIIDQPLLPLNSVSRQPLGLQFLAVLLAELIELIIVLCLLQYRGYSRQSHELHYSLFVCNTYASHNFSNGDTIVNYLRF